MTVGFVFQARRANNFPEADRIRQAGAQKHLRNVVKDWQGRGSFFHVLSIGSTIIKIQRSSEAN